MTSPTGNPPAPLSPDWPKLIHDALAATTRTAPTAHTVLKVLPSYSRPAIVAADDGREYAIKGPHLMRATVNEQIVGRLGQVIGAPVPEISFVSLPEPLAADLRGKALAPGDSLARVTQGLFHGLEFIPDCSDRVWIQSVDEPANLPRFAALAVMYGWFPAGDQQLIYANTKPHLVYSVDHGHFFAGGPDWTVGSLGTASSAGCHPDLWAIAQLDDVTRTDALNRLLACTPEEVARCVAAPPLDCHINVAERIAVAEYLWKRKEDLLRSEAIT